jgi:hypothetical protein
MRVVPRSKLECIVAGIACACASVVGCATGGPEVTARSSSAITHGAADPGDPAVVAIVGAPGTTACSGTLVAPHIVLTAGHCSVPEVVQGGHVVLGSSLAGADATIPIALAVAHPQFDLATLTNDVAILVLASAASAPPVPLGTSAPAVDSTVALVGWGLTAEDAGDTGEKRQGTSTVTSVASTTFDVASTPSQPCEGDSGGPALLTSSGVEAVEGITSHGDSACVAGATYTRVDAYLASFIQPTMAAYAAGSAATGATCLFPEQCQGGASACVAAADDASLTYCTTTCQNASDCPAAMACVGAQCRYPLPTPGTYGAPCASDTDCVEGECTSTNVCALRCVPTGATCPSGFACTNTADIDFFCIAVPPASGPKSSGCSLGAPADGATAPWLLAGAVVVRLARRARRRR